MFKFFKILVLLLLNFLCLVSIVQSSENKIRIGLLVPLTGENSEMGYQIIMIGHKGLMKYVTKVDESINNLTIISQIVTNEQYYLNYETGQFIHSG